MMRFILAAGLSRCYVCPVTAQDEPPRSLDRRLKIELFAENPQIVTPTGIDVDHQGRVWAVESNTHFPPKATRVIPTDRVLVMQDTDGNGRADKIVTFTDGLVDTMSIAVKPAWLDLMSRGCQPPLLSVFIATRRKIFLFHDDDGDLKADRK